MLVNADFPRPAIVTPDQYRWVASPQRGVERMMLDRVGEEQARATSIVRYAPASYFPRHSHPGGEEILVLSGTFSDEDGHYPAGWYLRNPPGSSHEPFSDEGAIIFVKLRQMAPGENRRIRIDTGQPSGWRHRGGHSSLPLFTNAAEQVRVERVPPREALFQGKVDGAELLVLAGELHFENQRCPRGSWIRLPAGEYPGWVASTQGATVYVKNGHLPNPAKADQSMRFA
ncbi:MAG: anti-sigma factor [Candidimonas sp.]|nr:MAG: anti-sigma factor [Candidimonas sp.]